MSTDRSGDAAWALWITGAPGSGKTTLTTALVDRLAARGIAATVLDVADVRRVVLPRPHGTPSPHGTPFEEELVHRALVAAAMLLTRAGVPVVIDATAPRRAWRRLARELIAHFAEVQLRCPPDVCGRRERTGRWAPPLAGRPGRGSTVVADAPDIVLDYEASVDADAIIDTDARDPSGAVEKILALALRLHRTATTRR